MRRLILLAGLLTMSGPATAQPTQIGGNTSAKPKPPTAARAEHVSGEDSSALGRAKNVQGVKTEDEAPAGGSRLRRVLDLPEEPEVELAEARVPFGARLYLTHDPTGFQKAWRDGSGSLPTAKTIGQANPIVVLVAVSGCARGKDGKCSIQFASRTAGPDGLFDQPKISPPWKPMPMLGKPELAPSTFGLRLGPGDPPGRYTIEVKVTDAVARTSRTLTGMLSKPPAMEEGR